MNTQGKYSFKDSKYLLLLYFNMKTILNYLLIGLSYLQADESVGVNSQTNKQKRCVGGNLLSILTVLNLLQTL